MEERKEIKKIRTYIPGKPIEEVQKELGLKDVIKLASNENTIGPANIVKNIIREKLNNINRYPDGSCYELIKILSKNLKVRKENVLAGNGSDEILVMIALAFINKGDEIIISEGTFSEYEFASQIMGAKIIKIPLKNYKYDLKSMSKKINNKTKVIFLANPNNPTGTIFSENELLKLLKVADKKVLIVLDEAYYDYITSKEYPDSLNLLKKYSNIAVLRTFSKAYSLAGLRIGYIVASSNVIKTLYKVRQPFNVNILAQAAAIKAIEDKNHIKLSKNINEEGKKYLYDEFKKLSINYVDTEANFIFINLKVNADIIFKKLLKEGIIVRPMAFFGFPKAIRVTIGTKEENKKLINAIKKLKIK